MKRPLHARRPKFLGTNHHEIICQPEDFDLLPKIVWHMDRPVGDALLIAFYKLAEGASKDLKVVLGGEGADEAFAGYSFQRVISKVEKMRRMFPASLLRSAAAFRRHAACVVKQVLHLPGGPRQPRQEARDRVPRALQLARSEPQLQRAAHAMERGRTPRCLQRRVQAPRHRLLDGQGTGEGQERARSSTASSSSNTTSGSRTGRSSARTRTPWRTAWSIGCHSLITASSNWPSPCPPR